MPPHSFLVMTSVVLFATGSLGSNRQRIAREVRSSHHDFSGGDVVRSLMATRTLDKLGGGELLRALDPYTGGQILRSLDQKSFLNSLDNFRGGEVLRMMDAVTNGELLSSLDSSDGVSVVNALGKTRQEHRTKLPKRMLDSVSGWAFGESKRNFDEIDNVGFNQFSKRWGTVPASQKNKVIKKNFDEIDRAGFETYNKRNFDEIDRTGFETFEKKDGKK